MKNETLTKAGDGRGGPNTNITRGCGARGKFTSSYGELVQMITARIHVCMVLCKSKVVQSRIAPVY